MLQAVENYFFDIKAHKVIERQGEHHSFCIYFFHACVCTVFFLLIRQHMSNKLGPLKGEVSVHIKKAFNKQTPAEAYSVSYFDMRRICLRQVKISAIYVFIPSRHITLFQFRISIQILTSLSEHCNDILVNIKYSNFK